MSKKILFAASEALPYVSSGGLADVVYSLPKALAAAGEDVRVILPLYDKIGKQYRDTMTFLGSINVSLGWRNQYCGVFTATLDGITYYFVDNEYYFRRGNLYGSYDDGERFAFFSKAVLETMPLTGFFPDILHAHDWQAACSVIYLKLHYNQDFRYNRMKTVFTIHNIEFQGKYGTDIIGDVFEFRPWERNIVEYDGCINLMKGAIECCDRLTTVSPRYAEEIESSEYAHGLEQIIRDKWYKKQGILNGIDPAYYNPETDRELYKNFSVTALAGKAENKLALQRAMALPEDANVPMVAMITRLTAQKGLDLVRRVIEEVLEDDIQLVILGTGDAEYENYFRDLENRRHDCVRSIIKYDKALSKQIYAAADLFLMPSKAEPCGLSQMIASAYGTVPIVRETGGLYDSIKSYNEYTGEGNGFTFTNYNAHDMMYTIRRALSFYKDKAVWNSIVKKVMETDFSWQASSKEYLEMYNQL